MQKKQLFQTLTLVLVLLLAAISLPVTAQDGSITDLAAENDDLSTLVSLIEAAGLMDALAADGITVFAPTNAAFEALPPDVIAFLGDNPDLLERVLTYHVVPGEVLMAADLSESMNAYATAEGGEVSAGFDGTSVRINSAFVVQADVEASNGVVHVIDTVLIPDIELEEVLPFEVVGDIATAGSSTVLPLSQHMVSLFTEEGFSGEITVERLGTTAGLERFCVARDTDISNASRPARDEEIETCAGNERPLIAFRVGTDALSVVVNPENDFVEALTLEQLAQIFTGEVTTWGEVVPEVAGTDQDGEIVFFSPGSDSGTFGYFAEEIADAAERELEDVELAIQNAPTVGRLSEDDEELVRGVEDNPNAIGYFGYAYYIANQERLKAIAIGTGDGEPIEPTTASVDAGTYPLARPLFLYSSPSVINEKPEVAGFLSYYLSNVTEVLVNATADPTEENAQYRYFPASNDALNAAKLEFLAVLAGMSE